MKSVRKVWSVLISLTFSPGSLTHNLLFSSAKKYIFIFPCLHFIEVGYVSNSLSIKFLFFPHVALVFQMREEGNPRCMANLHMICIFKWRRGQGTPTRALNSTLIGMYKGDVLGFGRTHSFVHLNIFERTPFSGLKRTPCFSKKSTQVFVHEAPALHRPSPPPWSPAHQPRSPPHSYCQTSFIIWINIYSILNLTV